MAERGGWRLAWVVATLLVAAGPGGTATASAADELTGFTRDARCSPNGKYVMGSQQRICQQGDQIWAGARYGGPPVDYEVCIRRGKGRLYCSEPAQTAPGETSVVMMPTKGFAGLVTVSWRSGPLDLGISRLRFVEDPVVPSFGLSPLIIAGTHRLFGLIIRHISPGLRVQATRVCPSYCSLPLKLAHQKGETRRYRITGSKRTSTFALGDILDVLVSLPNQSKIWSRIYQGRLVRDRSGGPRDTAIRRIDPPLCAAPGLPGITRKCDEVRNPEAGAFRPGLR